MPLPTSGQISMNDIRIELGSLANNFSLNGAESGVYGAINQNSANRPNGSTPNAMSEWYGYDHSAGGGGDFSFYCYTLTGEGRGGGTFQYWTYDGVNYQGVTQSISLSSGVSFDVCNYQFAPNFSEPIVILGSGTVEHSLIDCCNTTTTTTLPPPQGCRNIILAYSDKNSASACSNDYEEYFTNTENGIFEEETTKIYTDPECTSAASPGFYADQFGQWREWNGSDFIQFGFC
jgi:hypothetical protein